jgi:hypothetical protein
MWPDPEEGCASAQTPSLAVKTLRSRGAAAAYAFFLSAGGKRRCFCASCECQRLRCVRQSFVYRGVTADRTHNVPARVLKRSRSWLGVCQRSVKQAAVAPLPQWQAFDLVSFGLCGPLCSAAVAA